MSNFPPLEEIDQDITGIAADSTEFQSDDFLSREKAVLGDDAEAFSSAPVNNEKDAEDDDVMEFQSNYPEVGDTTAGVITESSEPYLPGQPELVSNTQKLSLEDSEAIKEWKARRELEIQRRDELSEQKKKETLENANKAIDDFYETYNAKRDDVVDKTRKEAEAFTEERDSSVVGGTTWDRIAKIIESVDKEVKSGIKDKSRFKELVNSLKGDVDAPGAAGY